MQFLDFLCKEWQINLKHHWPFLGCTFEAVSSFQCPSNPLYLSDCDISMETGTLCEADTALSDGTTNYDINNCNKTYDVFRCTRGNDHK